MKKVVLFLLTVSVSGIGISLESCYYDVESELYPTTTCDTSQFTYSATISNIVSDNCTICHNPTTLDGDIDLTTYALVRDQTENGNLLCAIKHEASCTAMPKDAGQLSNCNITLFELWAANGYPEN